jgi:anti-sigma B factor antagonist
VENKTIVRVKIDGYLDSSTFPRLQDQLNQLIEEKQYNFLLDLQDLDYISSAGLGVLMGILREVRNMGGDLKIINMSEKIERVFNLLGFSRLMRIYSKEEEALKAFIEAPEESSKNDNGEVY